jgi:uncharacterized cofD-like protein
MKVVGIGGGHGLAATLRAARSFADDVTGVVTVADDGGSSGRLTRELGIPPPGDIRNCLVALSDDGALAELFQHRFDQGVLTGHTLGNLVIAALTEITGNFDQAVHQAGTLIGVEGRVFPATTTLVELGARVEGGEIEGQVAVAQTPAPIQAVFLTPSDPPACSGAVDAILGADQIVLGPGSLFTSLIATLLVPGIRSALVATTARRVFVCNNRQQKGETEGLNASAHVGALLAHAGADSLDTVIVQIPEIDIDGVQVDREALDFMNVEVIEADTCSSSGLHDPEKLAKVLAPLHD